MLHLPPLQASLLKLPYLSYVNEQHSSRKKGKLAEGEGEERWKEEKREKRKKKQFTGFLDLNIYFYRNTKIRVNVNVFDGSIDSQPTSSLWTYHGQNISYQDGQVNYWNILVNISLERK